MVLPILPFPFLPSKHTDSLTKEAMSIKEMLEEQYVRHGIINFKDPDAVESVVMLRADKDQRYMDINGIDEIVVRCQRLSEAINKRGKSFIEVLETVKE